MSTDDGRPDGVPAPLPTAPIDRKPAQKAVKPPKPRKVEKRRRGRKG